MNPSMLGNMKNNEFIDKLRDTINHFELLEKGDQVLVAVSGGPDSVALLFGLFALKSEWDLKLYVAHLNHELRGKESDKDEKFVRNLASRLKLEFFSKKVDVRKEAKRQKLSIEECAREVRYRFLEETAQKIKADRIATGHQADDQAETFLMRMLRGAGGAGLSGIPPKRGKIIRPLIRITRKEIESFLKANKIAARVDSSNFLPDYYRNKIRLKLLPNIKREFNPNIVEVLNRTADIISSQQGYIENTCERILSGIADVRQDKIVIDLKKFTGYDICLQREIIRFNIKKLKGDLNRLSFASVDRSLELIRQKKSGKKIKLVGKIWLEVCEKEIVFFVEKKKKESDYLLTIPGEVILKNGKVRIKSEIIKSRSRSFIPPNQNIAYLDMDKMKKPFRLRNRRIGDKFKPLGMKGTKTLADFFIDAKVPHPLRDEVPILTSKGRIVWVVGYRMSEEFKVTEKTRKVLKVEIIPKELR
jgi:tRNA(Ile)-lysidine synthase